MTKKYNLIPGNLSLDQIKKCLENHFQFALSPKATAAINRSRQLVVSSIAKGEIHYGINTGFGKLASTIIPTAELQSLQENLVLSHATGVGADLPEDIVRLILLLKINSLGRGFSGVRASLIEFISTLYHHEIYPCIPSQGSVGASGDLAPLSHFSACLLGKSQVKFQGKKQNTQSVFKKIGISPLVLEAKEGLALINGLQVSTAIALQALVGAEKLINIALFSSALCLEAISGLLEPFSDPIHRIRGHRGQSEFAKAFRDLLQKSKVKRNSTQVQNPYSLRCQPQVMGACLDQLRFATSVLVTEANAVSDNPLVFADEGLILSGGNFHGEPVAMAADNMAIAIAEIGAISERRIALLMDPNFSHLPPFLAKNSGLHSGFMNAQVTAAALASENKSLAHPASVDSLPTSANQEDHVSMATYAARRLLSMLENTGRILSIEILAACQGIDFGEPENIAPALKPIYRKIRTISPPLKSDRMLSADIEKTFQGLMKDSIIPLKIRLQIPLPEGEG